MQTPEGILQEGIEFCQRGNLDGGIAKFRQALENNPRAGTKMIVNHNLAYALAEKAGVVWGPGYRVPVNDTNIAELDEALNRWDEVCKIYQEEVEGTPEEAAYSAKPSLKEFMKTAMNNGFAIHVKLDQYRGVGTFKNAALEKKSGCFIATAAFGSEFAPEVLYLQQFRSCVLSMSKYGRIFINVYYVISPPISRVISKSIILKTLTRYLLINPLIKILRCWYHDKPLTNSISKSKVNLLSKAKRL